MIKFIKRKIHIYQQKRRPLWSAILDNDVLLVHILLENGTDLNTVIDSMPERSFPNFNGYTPLTLAIRHFVYLSRHRGFESQTNYQNALQVILTLLMAGANINLPVAAGDNAADTPLCILVHSKLFDKIHFELAKKLIEAGADVFVKGSKDGGYYSIKADNLLDFAMLQLNAITCSYYTKDEKNKLTFPHVGLIKLLIRTGLDSKYLSPFVRSIILQEDEAASHEKLEYWIIKYLRSKLYKAENSWHYIRDVASRKEKPEYLSKVILNGYEGAENTIYGKPPITFLRQNVSEPDQSSFDKLLKDTTAERNFVLTIFRARTEFIMYSLICKTSIYQAMEIASSVIKLEICDMIAIKPYVSQYIAEILCSDVQSAALAKYKDDQTPWAKRLEEVLFSNIIKHLINIVDKQNLTLRSAFTAAFNVVLATKSVEFFALPNRKLIYDYVTYGLPIEFSTQSIITPDKYENLCLDILTSPDRYNSEMLQSYVNKLNGVCNNSIKEAIIIDDYFKPGNKDHLVSQARSIPLTAAFKI